MSAPAPSLRDVTSSAGLPPEILPLQLRRPLPGPPLHQQAVQRPRARDAAAATSRGGGKSLHN